MNTANTNVKKSGRVERGEELYEREKEEAMSVDPQCTGPFAMPYQLSPIILALS
jgi:hypothetical protein